MLVLPAPFGPEHDPVLAGLDAQVDGPEHEPPHVRVGMGAAHRRRRELDHRHGRRSYPDSGGACIRRRDVRAPDATRSLAAQAPAASSARRTITQARWRLYSVEPSRPGSGLMPSPACAAASAADAPEASAASTPRRAHGRRGCAAEPDAPAAAALRDRGADDRPVLRAPAELGVRALRLAAGDADLGDQLALLERGRVVVDEELVGRDRPRAGRALGDDLGAQRERDRGQVAVRIGLRERAADRAAVAHLLIADAGRRPPPERRRWPRPRSSRRRRDGACTRRSRAFRPPRGCRRARGCARCRRAPRAPTAAASAPARANGRRPAAARRGPCARAPRRPSLPARR